MAMRIEVWIVAVTKFAGGSLTVIREYRCLVLVSFLLCCLEAYAPVFLHDFPCFWCNEICSLPFSALQVIFTSSVGTQTHSKFKGTGEVIMQMMFQLY
jgi:uncharacterized membrane protein